MAGLIGSMVAGVAQGAGLATEKVGNEMLRGSILSELKVQEAEIQKQRDVRVAETQKELAQFQDELKRAPAREAMAGIEKANAPITETDEFGNVTTRSPTKAEQRSNTAKGLIGSGSPELMSAGLGMGEHDEDRALRQNEIDLRERSDERRHQDVVKRLDQQFAHQQKQDSISAGNASRMLMIAEEQTKGLKLDNTQKQQLVDLDKQWTDAKDDKTRETIAQRRAMLTGKWNESFEVKTGKDALGNDTVLGYIDKRRGTFTDPSGAITDMRTGQKVSGGGEAKPQWNQSTGEIRINGEIIGKAKTKEEADTVARGYKPGQAAPTAGAPAAPGLIASPGSPDYISTGDAPATRLLEGARDVTSKGIEVVAESQKGGVTKFLKNKIDNKIPLSTDERANAKRLGLIK